MFFSSNLFKFERRVDWIFWFDMIMGLNRILQGLKLRMP